ncbi:hypothetical protein ACI2K4_35190 [Micromonospora sp. NPDC050397]|uniref:hypothetical protein n=1 Tax=Micromonospora sp. NPDC050397 TaxID=3364279 RepID=UPI00384C9AB3
MSVRLKRLVVSVGMSLALVATAVTVPAVAASAAGEPQDCKPVCIGDGILRTTTSSPASGHRATDIRTNAVPITPPAVFPPNTPCYYEEVLEQVYETAQGSLMYDFHFEASVCLFPDQIVVYDAGSNVTYPGDQPDSRLTVSFSEQDRIVRINANEVDAYSDLNVTFCPDPAQPGTCQRYRHLLGLSFNPAFVFPFSLFQRLS